MVNKETDMKDLSPMQLSPLDTDKYKLTMHQIFHSIAPQASARYIFKNRTAGADLASQLPQINRALDQYCECSRFTADDLAWLEARPEKPYSSAYLDYLETFRFNRKNIRAIPDPDEPGAVLIEAEGRILDAMLFEIPVLSIVNESHFARYDTPDTRAEGQARLEAKLACLQNAPAGFKFADFGTRRRFCADWQDHVVATLMQSPCFAGTSNLYLAKKYGLNDIGTMAHEYLQAFQALSPELARSQADALNAWIAFYGKKLGIALTDVVGFDAFLRDFGPDLANAYSGLRHDSGNPYDWARKAIGHYRSLGIDPAEKTLVFSDGLTVDSAIELCKTFSGQAKLFFGIGTSLTNDLGPKALNIVMKIIECNGKPVAKISDADGKTMCKDLSFLQELREAYRIAPAAASRSAKL